jgi:hypothetical protein
MPDRRLGSATGALSCGGPSSPAWLGFRLSNPTGRNVKPEPWHNGRSPAIAPPGSARFAAPSDEALVLEAMRAARFSILVIERRHETAGLVATDLFRRATVWLVDIGLESSMPDGGVIATRLFTADRFAMTAGVNVPFDLAIVEDIHAELPRRLG